MIEPTDEDVDTAWHTSFTASRGRDDMRAVLRADRERVEQQQAEDFMRPIHRNPSFTPGAVLADVNQAQSVAQDEVGVALQAMHSDPSGTLVLAMRRAIAALDAHRAKHDQPVAKLWYRNYDGKAFDKIDFRWTGPSIPSGEYRVYLHPAQKDKP